MNKPITLKEHLDMIRKKAHLTQKKNGQFKKMAQNRWKKAQSTETKKGYKKIK